MTEPPTSINGYFVVEYGYFPHSRLPSGYLPPNNNPPLQPVQNLAICTADGVDGYYLLFCTPDWTYVTYSFNETIEATKAQPVIEFAQDVVEWHRRRA